MTLHDEIAEQPEVAARFLAAQAEPIGAIAASLRARPVRQVLIAARGTWLGPIVSIVPGQLHAWHLTGARGLDPERPRNLLKVTRTV